MSNDRFPQRPCAPDDRVCLKFEISFLALVCFVACSSSNSPPPTIKGTVVVTSSPPGLKLIAIDSNNLYWITFPNVSPLNVVNDLYATPKSGGSNTKLGQTSVSSIGSVGLDATTIYFPLNDTIVAAPIAGGPSRIVATGTTTIGLAVGNSNVYWVDDQGVTKSVPVGGGTPTLVPVPSGVLPGSGPTFTVASPDAFYACFPNGVLDVPFDGEAATWSTGQVYAFAADNTNTYFTVPNGNSSLEEDLSIVEVPEGGSTATVLTSAQYVTALTVDDQFVYFDAFDPAGIFKVSKGGGSVTTLANYDRSPGNLLVDETNVYWDDRISGTINKIAKN